jgi:hypothetical protein
MSLAALALPLIDYLNRPAAGAATPWSPQGSHAAWATH